MDKLYTIQEVADKLSLSDKTLRRWEEAGRFTPSRTLGNQRRYSLEDLQILDAIKHETISAQSDLLSIDQVAKLCGVGPTTVLRWENDGKIHPFITSGNTYYPRQKIMEKMADLKHSIPKEPQVIPPRPTAPPHPIISPVVEPPRLTPLPRPVQDQPTTIVDHGHFFSGPIVTNILVTLLLLLTYHLIFNPQAKNPISPTTYPGGAVQGATTSVADPRLDDLILKFQDHLSTEMLDKAKPAPVTTIHLDNTSVYGGALTLAKGSDQISYTHDKITPTTAVTASFTSDYSPAKKYWITTTKGSFTLHTDFALGQDASFNFSFLAPNSTASAVASSSATIK